MRFLEQLQGKRLLDDWIPILDWLLDGNYFSNTRGWDKNRVTQFTKKVKRLPSLSKVNWIVDAIKNQDWNANSGDVFVRMNTDNSEGRALIRHIRNSIAHGKCTISGSDDRLLIKMEDFNTDKQQTSNMSLPIEHIKSIYAIYHAIENNPSSIALNKQSKKRKDAA